MKSFKIFTLFIFSFIIFFFVFYKFLNIKNIANKVKINFLTVRKEEIKKKLASLFIVNINGTTLNKNTKEFLSEYRPGGIILLQSNIYDTEQIKRLIIDIRKIYNPNKVNPLEPLIAIDQEGGRVNRIKHGIKTYPSQYESALKGKAFVEEMAYNTNLALRELGININFSPVCDVLKNDKNKVIGDRAFGKDEDFVSKMVDTYLKSANKTNIINCAKHFPGHGFVSIDSHISLPVDNTKKENLLLKPFKVAIKNNVKMIMPAHIIYKEIDDLPATMSNKILNILRNELNFKGIIISDDLSMGAIKKNYKIENVVVEALKAGMDMFIYTEKSIKDHKKLIDDVINILVNDEDALYSLDRAIRNKNNVLKD